MGADQRGFHVGTCLGHDLSYCERDRLQDLP